MPSLTYSSPRCLPLSNANVYAARLAALLLVWGLCITSVKVRRRSSRSRKRLARRGGKGGRKFDFGRLPCFLNIHPSGVRNSCERVPLFTLESPPHCIFAPVHILPTVVSLSAVLCLNHDSAPSCASRIPSRPGTSSPKLTHYL